MTVNDLARRRARPLRACLSPVRPRRAFLPWCAGALVTVMFAAGCAGIPTSGVVESTPTPPASGLGGAACCGLIVRGPQPGWTPEEIVTNFLLASASFAQDHAIAREYLTPAANRNWQPQSPVTIVAQAPRVRRVLSQRPFGPAIVTVTGQAVATLDRSGQYLPAAPGGTAHEQNFGLARNKNGQWRISSLPSTGLTKVSRELLLTTSLFHLVYEPHNLYFYAARNHTLLPNPVFLPAGSANLVTDLVKDLFHDPKGWLEGAAVTAFPPGAKLRGVHVVPGPERTAIVDLTVPGGVTETAEEQMAEQLVLTLTGGTYGRALFQGVKLRINGHTWPLGGGPSVQKLTDYQADIPHWRNNPMLYFIGSNGGVRALGRQAARSVTAPGEAGSGRLPLNEVAVSPDGQHLAGVAGPANTVYVAGLSTAKPSGPSAGSLRTRLTGSDFSAPTWDNADDLWVAGRVNHSRGVWVILPGDGAPVRVGLPNGVGPVTGLRIAPDGVRIAMIVGAGANAHLRLGAIVRSGTRFFFLQTVPLGTALTGVKALTWYDEDHLLVVSESGGHTRLCEVGEVPVTGEGALCRSVQAGTVSITAAGRQNPLYLGLSNGRLQKSVGLNEPWTDAGLGRQPVYPG